MQTLFRISKVVFFSMLVGVVFFAAYFLFKPTSGENALTQPEQISVEQTQPSKTKFEGQVADVKDEISVTAKAAAPQSILIKVPFTSQAPSGKWSNPLFENGCEEASVAMAMAWAQGKNFSTIDAEKEILDISAWEKKTFGFAVDSSVDDTARMVREYYNHKNVEVLRDVTASDIRKELAKGHIILVPVEGKILANPHYTPPFPDQHMLVVTGYDSKRDEFITNDPGTKFGENYSYDSAKFTAAIWSYPTGFTHTAYPGSLKVQRDVISIGN